MADYTDDKAKYRDLGTPYTIDSKIGRQVPVDKAQTSTITVSGSVVMLPETPLPRRDYIKITNNGPYTVELYTTSVSGANGISVPINGTWEETTTADIYIVSTGPATAISVYERATRINKG